MSAVAPPRTPDVEVKGGTAIPLNFVFSSAGTPFTPSGAVTLTRTKCSDGTTTSLTATYSGTAGGGYTCNDIPPSSSNQEIYWYEWKGVDTTKNASGDLVVKVRPSIGV